MSTTRDLRGAQKEVELLTGRLTKLAEENDYLLERLNDLKQLGIRREKEFQLEREEWTRKSRELQATRLELGGQVKELEVKQELRGKSKQEWETERIKLTETIRTLERERRELKEQIETSKKRHESDGVRISEEHAATLAKYLAREKTIRDELEREKREQVEKLQRELDEQRKELQKTVAKTKTALEELDKIKQEREKGSRDLHDANERYQNELKIANKELERLRKMESEHQLSIKKYEDEIHKVKSKERSVGEEWERDRQERGRKEQELERVIADLRAEVHRSDERLKTSVEELTKVRRDYEHRLSEKSEGEVRALREEIDRVLREGEKKEKEMKIMLEQLEIELRESRVREKSARDRMEKSKQEHDIKEQELRLSIERHQSTNVEEWEKEKKELEHSKQELLHSIKLLKVNLSAKSTAYNRLKSESDFALANSVSKSRETELLDQINQLKTSSMKEQHETTNQLTREHAASIAALQAARSMKHSPPITVEHVPHAPPNQDLRYQMSHYPHDLLLTLNHHNHFPHPHVNLNHPPPRLTVPHGEDVDWRGLKEKIDRLTEEVTRKEGVIDGLNKEKSSLQAQLKTKKIAATENVKRLELKITELEGALKSSSDANQTLVDKTNKLEKTISKLKLDAKKAAENCSTNHMTTETKHVTISTTPEQDAHVASMQKELASLRRETGVTSVGVGGTTHAWEGSGPVNQELYLDIVTSHRQLLDELARLRASVANASGDDSIRHELTDAQQRLAASGRRVAQLEHWLERLYANNQQELDLYTREIYPSHHPSREHPYSHQSRSLYHLPRVATAGSLGRDHSPAAVRGGGIKRRVGNRRPEWDYSV